MRSFVLYASRCVRCANRFTGCGEQKRSGFARRCVLCLPWMIDCSLVAGGKQCVLREVSSLLPVAGSTLHTAHFSLCCNHCTACYPRRGSLPLNLYVYPHTLPSRSQKRSLLSALVCVCVCVDLCVLYVLFRASSMK